MTNIYSLQWCVNCNNKTGKWITWEYILSLSILHKMLNWDGNPFDHRCIPRLFIYQYDQNPESSVASEVNWGEYS